MPAGDQGKRIFIDFDGAMANAKVWLNGQYVGGWPYGYQPFRLELTPHVKFGAENVLAVRLDTVHWGSRWYPGAGIYRNVWLVKTNPVHVGHWGVYVTTPSITDDEGKATAGRDASTTRATEAASVTVQAEIFELGDRGIDRRTSRVIGHRSMREIGPAAASGKVELDASVPNPKRWDLGDAEPLPGAN